MDGIALLASYAQQLADEDVQADATLAVTLAHIGSGAAPEDRFGASLSHLEQQLQQLPDERADTDEDAERASSHSPGLFSPGSEPEEYVSAWLAEARNTWGDVSAIVTMVSAMDPKADGVIERCNRAIEERCQNLSEKAADTWASVTHKNTAAQFPSEFSPDGEQSTEFFSPMQEKHGHYPRPAVPGGVSEEQLRAAMLKMTRMARRPKSCLLVATSDEDRGDLAMQHNLGSVDPADLARDDAPWRVCDGLWLSDSGGARDGDRLRRVGVTHCLRLSEQADPGQIRSLRECGIELIHYEALDSATYDLLGRHLGKAFALWRAVEKRRGQLCVHCHAGMNRSACICVALIMAGQGLRLIPAIQRCATARRNNILSNANFREQLLNLAVMLDLLLPL